MINEVKEVDVSIENCTIQSRRCWFLVKHYIIDV